MPTDPTADLPADWESISCPLCGGAENKRVLEAGDLVHRVPGTFQLVQCCQCGHYYVNPRPTVAGIAPYYPTHYGPHLGESESPPDQDAPTTSAPAERRKRRWLPGLRRLYYWLKENHGVVIPPKPQEHPVALELGCGVGGFLKELQSAGWQAQGIELSSNASEIARSKGLDVYTGTLEPGRFPAESFDAIFAWMVLEHLHDPLAMLHEIRRLLKPDGRFLFSVPNYASFEASIFGRYWYSLQLPVHLHHFTPKVLSRILAETGFRIESIRGQNTAYDTVGSLGLWLREHFPRLRVGDRMVDWNNHPGVWSQLLLSPLSKSLAWSGHASRLTLSARPEESRNCV